MYKKLRIDLIFLLLILVISNIFVTYLGVFSIQVASILAMSAVLLLLLQFRKSNSNDWIFAICLFGPILLSVVLTTTGFYLFGIWQVAIILLATTGLTKFITSVKKDKLIQLSILLFFSFILCGVYSTMMGRSRFDAASYQLISDFKPFAAIVMGFALGWDPKIERILWMAIRFLWIPLLLILIFEWVLPGQYVLIFGSKFIAISDDPSRIFPSRASSLFEHPAMFANSSAAFCIITSARAIMHEKDRIRNWCLSVIYFIFIITAVQRQEMAACFISILFIYLLYKPEGTFKRFSYIIFISVIAAFLFWLVFAQTFNKEGASWGFGTIGQLEHPRAQIYAGALILADENIPFGSGLGTFGGAGAEKFDTSIYESLGFRNYWWYGHEDFLMDTYWPNSIAETGFLGALSLFFSYFLFLIYTCKVFIKSKCTSKYYWAISAGLFLYILIISFTSPAFQDLRLFLLPGLMIGVASKYSELNPNEI